MDFGAALRLIAWGILVVVALQVVFYLVFQVIGYDSFLLSVTLIVSVLVGFGVLWRRVARKKQLQNQPKSSRCQRI